MRGPAPNKSGLPTKFPANQYASVTSAPGSAGNVAADAAGIDQVDPGLDIALAPHQFADLQHALAPDGTQPRNRAAPSSSSRPGSGRTRLSDSASMTPAAAVIFAAAIPCPPLN